MKPSKLTRTQFFEFQEAYGSDSSIAKKMNVSRQAVSRVRRKLNIKIKETLMDRNEWIINQYNQDVSVHDIAESKNLSVSHVYKIISKRPSIQLELNYE